jgi:hypothetical protein
MLIFGKEFMEKIIKRKITLNKKTIRVLTTNEQTEVVGGATQISRPNSCGYACFASYPINCDL